MKLKYELIRLNIEDIDYGFDTRDIKSLKEYFTYLYNLSLNKIDFKNLPKLCDRKLVFPS